MTLLRRVAQNLGAPARLASRKARSATRRARWWLIDALEPRRRVRARDLCLTLQCDNWITSFRMDTLETKEPETLDWIDAQVRDGDLLFDIGGNIGVISAYAALRHQRARVVVFEPEYSNLHLLRDNIVANGLSERVLAYPFALGDRTGLSRLHVQDLTPGAAMHSESEVPLRTTESGARVVLSVGTWSMRLDDFCQQSGLWPDALKIDVDGHEDRVLAGATEALSRPALRSLLVEGGHTGLSTDACARLRSAGFSPTGTSARSEARNEVWVR
jgi:FkbM family methyltransferase